jgi:hypothetical protein
MLWLSSRALGSCTRGKGLASFVQKRDRLDARDLEALAAANILAGHHVVTADHIRLGFGELGAIALVGAAGKLLLLGTHQPGELIFTRLAAVRTGQRMRLFGFFFVKKVSFIHVASLQTVGASRPRRCVYFI